jgi:hypothetical protein
VCVSLLSSVVMPGFLFVYQFLWLCFLELYQFLWLAVCLFFFAGVWLSFFVVSVSMSYGLLLLVHFNLIFFVVVWSPIFVV